MKDTVKILTRYSDLPTKILLSKKRKPQYYKKGKPIPKKYQGYNFDKKGRIIDESGEPIIKNIRSINKARYYTINFQQLWSGNLHHSTRNKVKWELTKFFESNLPPPITSFPIMLIFKSRTTSKADVDNNSFIYIKSFFDTLVKNKIIPDDTKEYIQGYSWEWEYSTTPSLDVYYKEV
jgi:Holliday junction resolvase RusA-like endonuclease